MTDRDLLKQTELKLAIAVEALELEKVKITEIVRYLESRDDEDGLASRIMQQFEYDVTCRINEAIAKIKGEK